MAEAKAGGGGEPRTRSRPAPDMRLARLFVYPVKSARGVEVQRATVTPTGLLHDRRFMVVDDAGAFVTQRTEPRLALLETGLTDSSLRLSAADVGEVEVPLYDEPTGPEATVEVWGDLVQGREAPEAEALVSDLLGARRRLVRFSDDAVRPVPSPSSSRARTPRRLPGDAASRVMFADAYPFLMIGQGSLDDLARRLDPADAGAAAPERFRPNLVVSGTQPHEEDAWVTVMVGQVRFTVAKPCVRCSIPSVDPATARVGREPLRTLATYRRDSEGRVTFGQNLLHHGVGTLEVGDPVSVESVDGA